MECTIPTTLHMLTWLFLKNHTKKTLQVTYLAQAQLVNGGIGFEPKQSGCTPNRFTELLPSCKVLLEWWLLYLEHQCHDEQVIVLKEEFKWRFNFFQGVVDPCHERAAHLSHLSVATLILKMDIKCGKDKRVCFEILSRRAIKGA